MKTIRLFFLFCAALAGERSAAQIRVQGTTGYRISWHDVARQALTLAEVAADTWDERG